MRRSYQTTHTKPVISIVMETPLVYLDNTEPSVWKRFYCHVCGKVAFEYQTKVRVILAGQGPETASGVARVQCKNCSTLYEIAS